MERIDDYQHIERLARGEHESFRLLFMHYFPKLKFFMAQLVKSDAVAEELAQDIFVKLWEKRQALAAVQSLNAYLYRMGKNAAINYLNHRGVENRFRAHYTPQNDLPADALFQAKETALLIGMTVERMPAQRKKIFEMSRTAQLKNEEIAQQLHLSKKTVENHLNLALKEIRKTVSSEG